MPDYHSHIEHPERLAALRRTLLLDSAEEEAFDRLTRLATKVLEAPVALVSLVDEDRQFFKSIAGLSEPWASHRETPLSHSFCQYVAATREPLIIEDAREHPLVRENLAITDLGVIAYLGIPLITNDGYALGSFCVIDSQPRSWSDDDIAIVRDLAASVVTEIEYRAATLQEKQRAEEAEQAYHDRLALIESTGEGIYGVDLDGCCTFINRAGAGMLGYAPDDLLGQNMHALIHGQYPDGSPYPEADCPIYQAFHEGRSIRVDDEVLWRRDGSPFPVEYSSHPVIREGVVQGAVVTFQDITERRRHLDQERERARQLRELADAALIINSTRTLDSMLTIITERASAIIGAHQAVTSFTIDQDWSRAINAVSLSDKYAVWRDRNVQLVGSDLYAIVCRENRPCRMTQAELEAHPAWGGSGDEAGKRPPLRGLLAAPLVGRDERNLGLIQVSDKYEGEFTEEDEAILVQLAQMASVAIENTRLYEEAREAARVRQEFLSIASHELRTPLTSLKVAAQLAQRVLRRDTVDLDRIRRPIEQLSGEVGRLEVLVGDLLDLSRIQQGRLELRVEQLDLASLAREIIERFEHRPERSERHTVQLDAPEPVIGAWDASRLDQVVTNLLSNALKYSPEGGVVRVMVRRCGDTAELAVRDEGIGMPAEEQARLFQPFMRGDSARSITTGTGLGLHITKQIVEYHGGTIVVESAPGEGTQFTVRLPLVAPDSLASDPDLLSVDAVEPVH